MSRPLLALRPADEAMGVETVGTARDLVKPVGNAFSLAIIDQRLTHRIGAVLAGIGAEFLLHVRLVVDALGGDRRVQFERAEDEFHLQVRDQFDCVVHPALAKPTPGANQVRYHFDYECHGPNLGRLCLRCK